MPRILVRRHGRDRIEVEAHGDAFEKLARILGRRAVVAVLGGDQRGVVPERLAVTPGITFIWQVSGRSDIDFETWVEMDLEYIETWNLRKDLKILLLTVPAVLSGRGAY